MTAEWQTGEKHACLLHVCMCKHTFMPTEKCYLYMMLIEPEKEPVLCYDTMRGVQDQDLESGGGIVKPAAII